MLREIIKRDIFPKLTKQLSADIIKLMIERLFALTLVAIVLGFAGFILMLILPQYTVENNAKIEGYIQKVHMDNGHDNKQILPEKALLKEGPSIGSITISNLPKWQKIEIIDKIGDWVKIETDMPEK